MIENKNKLRRKKRKLPCDSVSYTTGSIDLNINRFNQAFGTADSTAGGTVGDGSSSLVEAKRYVRRYYFRRA